MFVLIFLALTTTITLACRESFFGTAYYEEGDDAANALQIERAKRFRELHGNYSRMTFHHPGPAFFYAYAAGEWLLHDVTGIAPAPRNAHLYAGLLTQLAFYVAAIALLARHSRQPLLAATLALAAGALHFVQIERDHVFYSIWPPDVVIMPFLSFIVAAAAVSVRDRAALPVLVVSGGFLVHGHVAQPLFVVPITLIALWLSWRPDWRGGLRSLGRDRPGRLALVLLALFLVPLGLDLLAGRESNFAGILRHLRYNTDAGQTLWQSVLCYVSYFVPLDDQAIFNELSAASYAPLRERAGLLITWIGVLTGTVWWLWRLPASRDQGSASPDLRFGRRLIVLWLVASALTLVWGMRQDGGLTSYNSDLNHALVHLLGLIAILALVNALPAVPRRFGWLTLAAAVPAFALALPVEPEVGSRGDEVTVRLQGLLQADPRPAAPKLITWDIPGEDWYEAVTIARALQRRGIEFYVHPSWQFMFGADKVFDNEADALGRGAISLWYVTQRKRAPAGAHVLDRDYSVVFTDAVKEQSLPLRLDFVRNQPELRTFGIAQEEKVCAWTEGETAAILFNTPASADDLEIELEASAFVSKLTPNGQRFDLRINGTFVGHHRVGQTRQRTHFTVPCAVWNCQTPQIVVFELPEAVSPAMAGQSADQRLLGLSLYELTLSTRPR